MRAALAGALLLLATAQPAQAQDDQVDDTAEAQADGGVPAPVIDEQPAVVARVRLTYYLESGITASGQRTYAGATACSRNFRFGTRFVFRDGETVTCNDRGLLGSSGWLDVWRQKWLADKYGPYAVVRVLEP